MIPISEITKKKKINQIKLIPFINMDISQEQNTPIN